MDTNNLVQKAVTFPIQYIPLCPLLKWKQSSHIKSQKQALEAILEELIKKYTNFCCDAYGIYLSDNGNFLYQRVNVILS